MISKHYLNRVENTVEIIKCFRKNFGPSFSKKISHILSGTGDIKGLTKFPEDIFSLNNLILKYLSTRLFIDRCRTFIFRV